jgi:hypothetical protein
VPFHVPPAFLFACRSGAGASENGSRSRDAA